MPVKRRQRKPNLPRTKSKVIGNITQWRLRGLLAVVLISSALYYFGVFSVRKPPIVEHDDLFSVVDLPRKGKGLVASRDIQQGELVIREKPFFLVPHKISSSPTDLIARLVNQLSPTDRATYYNLSYANLPSDPPMAVALAIFQTNAVAAGERVGIFPRMARLNHGCSRAFNMVYTWREREGELMVHALKDIKKGQELLTTYMDTKKSRHERREWLSRNYGFHCACEVCSLPEVKSRASDEHLTMMFELHGQLGSWNQQRIDGKEAISIIQNIWSLGEKEEYWSERGQLAANAAWVAAAHSDATGVTEWAQLAIKWYAIELGADSEYVLEMQNVMTQPQRHRVWGTRNMMTVGGPSTT